MLELVEIPRLPYVIGDKAEYFHAGTAYQVSVTGTDTWAVTTSARLTTIAVLSLDHIAGERFFTLRGPTIDLAGPSWMLLLSQL